MNVTSIPELTQFEHAYLAMPNECTSCGAASVSRFALVSTNPALEGMVVLHTLCKTCANKADAADLVEAKILKGN